MNPRCSKARWTDAAKEEEEEEGLQGAAKADCNRRSHGSYAD
jgi:hypothetical protein